MFPVVRRDDADSVASASRCSSPAGASPVSVSAGAPSSRPQASEEIPVAQAGCRKPLRRKPARGPQHQVKPAASSDSQSESRAGHVAAKAMSAMPQSGGVRVAGLGGVWGAARVQGDERNTRGPSARPGSGHSDSYKPMAKSSRAQRESEGVVVLPIAATNNAAGGKDPCSGLVDGAATREGMTGRSGSNHPTGRESSVKARHPQTRLGSRPSDGRSTWPCRCCSRRRDLLRAPHGCCWHRTACTMPRSDRPPESRVREIRTHGLNGGLTHIRLGNQTGDSRIYQ
jgi:hypothetical protein